MASQTPTPAYNPLRAMLERMRANTLPDVACPKCGEITSSRAVEDLGCCVDCHDALLKARDRGEALQARLRGSGMPPRWQAATFASTQPGPDQAQAYSLCRSWRWGPEGLYLWGPPGTGKSRLAACLANQVMNGWLDSNNPANSISSQPALWVSVPQVLVDLKHSFSTRDSRPRDTLALAQLIPMLVLDDLGAEFSSELGQTELLPVLDSRVTHLLPTVITSNLPMSRDEKYPQTLADRVGSRIAERVIETCRLVFVGGTSQRVEIARARGQEPQGGMFS